MLIGSKVRMYAVAGGTIGTISFSSTTRASGRKPNFYPTSGRKSWLPKRHHTNNFRAVFNQVDRQNGRNSSPEGMSGQMGLVTGLQSGSHIVAYRSSGQIETGMHRDVGLAVFAHSDVKILGKVRAVG